jgi:hypothetical protein
MAHILVVEAGKKETALKHYADRPPMERRMLV